MTEVLRQSVTQGRAVLQRVLQGRITFRPNGAGYTFEAPTRFDKLFAAGATNAAAGLLVSARRRGHRRHAGEDTLDADYGGLLENSTVKGWRPQGELHEWVRRRRSSRDWLLDEDPRHPRELGSARRDTAALRAGCR